MKDNKKYSINEFLKIFFNKKALYVYASLVLCVVIIFLKESRAFVTYDPNIDSVNLTFNQITPTDKDVTYERIIMQNAEQRKLGTNGAGCQWPVSLESSSNGDLMLYGIDVASLYKSTDHGENWVMANSGMESRGVGMFAIDPYNSNHVLALGIGKSGAIHVSYDKANTWKKTFAIKTTGSRYLWDGLEFDPTSYDESLQLTKDAYFSTPYERDTHVRNSPEEEPSSQSPLEENQVGLYKTSDGGETFTLIINDRRLADGIIRITDNGKVYVGNQYGLFLIDKENYTFQNIYFENDPEVDYSKGVTGLDVVGNTLYVQTWDGIYTLENDVVTKITNDNYINKWPQFLEVSKSNPNHIIYQVRKNVTNYYVTQVVVSFDGGETWTYAYGEVNSLFFKSNWVAREKLFIIDPSNDNNVLAFGLDDLMRSTDGGLNFKQTKGISNMMQGGRFNFNYYDPDLLLFSAQDYSGVISTDGGVTYSQLFLNKGNFYGGFAADEDTIYGFANASWNGGTLTYTHDGGDTWVDTGLTSSMPSSTYYSSLQSPTNPNVLFAAEYYSKDKGYTWNKMNGCKSVFTFNYTNQKELYGGDDDGSLVVSYDNGDTWEKLSTSEWESLSVYPDQVIIDIAYDHVNNYAYVIVQFTSVNDNVSDGVYKYDITNRVATKLTLPSNKTRHRSIAVDPNSTSVVYIGGNASWFSTATALIRSIDGGITWSVLTTSNNANYPSKATNQGGYEVSNLRVNPYDGRVWISSGCYGYETFDPPYDASLLNHEKPQNHVIKYMYNGNQVNETILKNNEKHNYVYEEDNLTFISWYKDSNLTEEFPNNSNVYESMTLYAKMQRSVKVKFYDRNKLLWKMDLDAYDKGDENQIPTRDGYAFAGWYIDKELNTLADFSNITTNTSVYAGWYKVLSDVFDINKKDIANYIKYSNYVIQDAAEVDNTEQVNDRCIHLGINPNSTYYISFKMANRFRLGMRLNNFKYWPHNPVLSPYIDEKDIDGNKVIDEYVYKVIETGDYKDLLIHYYTWKSGKNFMDIKSTFKIFKIKNQNVQENNEKIEGIDYSITKGANQTYTINTDQNATFYSNGESAIFDFIEVDGETIDSSNYTLENGPAIVTLKKEFMDSLTPNKEHIFNLVFKDGGEATTSFYISTKKNNSKIDNKTETGKNDLTDISDQKENKDDDIEKTDLIKKDDDKKVDSSNQNADQEPKQSDDSALRIKYIIIICLLATISIIFALMIRILNRR